MIYNTPGEAILACLAAVERAPAGSEFTSLKLEEVRAGPKSVWRWDMTVTQQVGSAYEEAACSTLFEPYSSNSVGRIMVLNKLLECYAQHVEAKTLRELEKQKGPVGA